MNGESVTAEKPGVLARSLLRRFRTWRRRRKVSKAYSLRAHAELDKRVGFTPLMKKWELLERDGYVELTDEGTEWVWP